MGVAACLPAVASALHEHRSDPVLASRSLVLLKLLAGDPRHVALHPRLLDILPLVRYGALPCHPALVLHSAVYLLLFLLSCTHRTRIEKAPRLEGTWEMRNLLPRK